jgi:hypothetical protein
MDYQITAAEEELIDLLREHRAAVIRPFSCQDQAIGNKVSVSISKDYSILCIGPREYYFDRETGELDGTGFDLRSPEEWD